MDELGLHGEFDPDRERLVRQRLQRERQRNAVGQLRFRKHERPESARADRRARRRARLARAADQRQRDIVFAESISCLSTGTHTFVVRARPCGDPNREAVAVLPVAVDTTPQLTLTLTNPDADGNVTISGHVIFPNAPPSGIYAGGVDIYVNDETRPRWREAEFDVSQGLQYHTLNVTCAGAYTVRSVATACSGNTATQHASGGQPGMTQPLVTLDFLGFDSSGNPRMHATVKYAFPLPSSGWNVNLQLLRPSTKTATSTRVRTSAAPPVRFNSRERGRSISSVRRIHASWSSPGR
jgi:hypothetical protein